MDEAATKLLTTTRDELAWTLRYALLFDGRKGFYASRDYTANVTATNPANALERSDFVIMRRAAPACTPAPPTKPTGDR